MKLAPGNNYNLVLESESIKYTLPERCLKIISTMLDWWTRIKNVIYFQEHIEHWSKMHEYFHKSFHFLQTFHRLE